MSDVVERLFRTLVDEIRAKRPEYLHEPFTVAEIYQNLVPYSSHRDRIGVEMNGDYEDALLRLLAGQGGYAVLESTPALRALRAELESSNPNTGLYREFAAVDVRLDPARLYGSVPHQASAAGLPAMAVEDLAPDEREAAAPGRAASGGDAGATTACRWCRAELPARQNVKFCPFCGTDVHVVPCPGCGEELEPEWRFCVACGAEVAP